MKDLTFILKQMKNISERPEKDFAKIFEDKKQYFTLRETLYWAYGESYKAPIKLANEENLQMLQIALMRAGLGFHSNRMIYDIDYRLEVVRKLRRKEKAKGVQYFDLVHQSSLDHKMVSQQIEERGKKVTCLQCGLEQRPVKNYVMCPRCRFQGAVIGNLYKGLAPSDELRLKILAFCADRKEHKPLDFYHALKEDYSKNTIDKHLDKLINEEPSPIEVKAGSKKTLSAYTISEHGIKELREKLWKRSLGKWIKLFRNWKAVGKMLELSVRNLEESGKGLKDFSVEKYMEELKRKKERIDMTLTQYVKKHPEVRWVLSEEVF